MGDERTKPEMNALHEAAQAGDVLLGEALLPIFNVDEADAKGLAAIHHAAFEGHLATAELLFLGRSDDTLPAWQFQTRHCQ